MEGSRGILNLHDAEGHIAKKVFWGSNEGMTPFPKTWTKVSGLSIQVEARRRPVLIILTAAESSEFPSGLKLFTFAYNISRLRIIRDDTTVLGEFPLELTAASQNNPTKIGSEIAIPAAVIQAFDPQPGRETHRYDVEMKSEEKSTGYTSLTYVRLLAIEF